MTMFSKAMSEAEKQKAFYENQARQDTLVESLFVNPDKFSGNAEARARAEFAIKEELNPTQLQQSIDRVSRKIQIAEERQREAEAIEAAKTPADKGREQIPTYRDSYEVGEITSFAEAKQAADETYMQYWYDKANKLSSKWTDEDYALIAEPKYEKFCANGQPYCRVKQTRRIVPEGYDEYVEVQERIDAGPLDFSSEETHKMLIKPPTGGRGGYTGRQHWISEDNPLRQAVEAQADVMKDFLDAEGIPIVQKYEDLEGFDRPDSFRGEGIYLNTGTGAHIDWDSGLKRMQRYQTSPDAELGTYSNVFVRPDPEGIAKPLAFVGSITGNPWLSGASAIAAGGDLEDALKGAVKGYAIGQVTAPILENTVANLGIDKDLFGMDAEAFSEGMMDVQTAILEGKDIEEALLKEFGVPAVKQIAGAVGDMLPDIDLPESQLFSDIGDALEPVVDAVKAGGRFIDDTVLQPVKENVLEPVVDVAQKGIDVVQEVTQPISDVTSEIEDVIKQGGREFDEAVLQPVKDFVEDIELPEAPDFPDLPDLPDLPDIPMPDLPFSIGGLLDSGMPQQKTTTPVENIFDKELFKIDTEIKSTQEMLSPIMNLRRYG